MSHERFQPPPISRMGSFVAVIATLSLVPEAQAACPAPYDTAVCDDPGTDVCRDIGISIECDLGRDDPGGPGMGAVGGLAYAVYNGSSLCGDAYCIFGTESSGTPFCCEMPTDDQENLILRGTDYDDELYLHYTGGYNLENWTTSPFEGIVIGQPGNDLIEGSNDTLNYHDNLSGNGGSDYIYGNVGGDEIDGGSEADFLFGGLGEDLISGDLGADVIEGNDNADTIYGGGGDDEISGGDGNDTVQGDAGDDLLCGDDGNDTLSGNNDDDTIWGGVGTDAGHGNNHAGSGDTCDSGTTETRTGCENVSSFTPTCPGP